MTTAAADQDPTEGSYLGLLDGLKHLEITGNEVSVVSRIAAFAPSPRVLAAIYRVPKWYTRWEIREALAQNPAIPEGVRTPIDTTLAVIDLMRELDSRKLEELQKEEVREDIRSLLKSLPAMDVEVVRARARALAAASRTPAGSAPPRSIGDLAARTEQAAKEVAAERASTIESADFLHEALADPREAVRQAALENPSLIESVLLAALERTSDPRLLGQVVLTPRWALREPIRRAVLASPAATPAVRTLLTRTDGLLMTFMSYFNEPREPEERARLAKGLLADVQELSGTEREYLKFKIGPAWTPFLGDVMGYIEAEFATLQPTPVTRPASASGPAPARATAAPPPPAEVMLPVELDDRHHAPAPLHVQPVRTETRRSLTRLSVEERVGLARATTSRDELGFLLHDNDDRVFDALLTNPVLGDEEIVNAARTASGERIRRIQARADIYSLPAVKLALLHNPNATESLQLDCLNHVGNLRELVHVMRDPRIRSLEVKTKARGRLVDRYRAMTPEERAAAIRQSGGDILTDLWTEAFADERTLLKLVQDRALDEGVLLRIVRSRIAPREVLLAIGREPAFISHYQVRLELALNPKTPREVVAKLVPRLSPADRKRLKESHQVAEYVRALA